jgi:hypothetical protein
MILAKFSLPLIDTFAVISARRTRTVASQTGNRPQSMPGAAFDIVALAASARG